ncbi:hypothetical protein Ate01nite_51690 [Actinoplanes teichomyceticus]|nr:hypothetical protein Ate01nite_51690 [Actinoplanes teichomyceticus]
MWLTPTLDSYGPVHSIHAGRPCACRRRHTDDDPLLGTPIDPARYDYRRGLGRRPFPTAARQVLAEPAPRRGLERPVRRRRVNVAVVFSEVRGELIEGTPKNHQRRSVPIPRFLVEELAAHVAGKSRDALVFTSPNGGPLRNTNFRPRFFTPAAESVGLTGLTPHDLRHTAASLAVAAGANVKAVQRMLGHASAAMTLDVYADLFEGDLDHVADRLDQTATRGADHLRTAGLPDAVVDLFKRRSPGH